ncbi:hypothetical protein QTP88_027315 [Uroleucon formosanum]
MHNLFKLDYFSRAVAQSRPNKFSNRVKVAYPHDNSCRTPALHHLASILSASSLSARSDNFVVNVVFTSVLPRDRRACDVTVLPPPVRRTLVAGCAETPRPHGLRKSTSRMRQRSRQCVLEVSPYGSCPSDIEDHHCCIFYVIIFFASTFGDGGAYEDLQIVDHGYDYGDHHDDGGGDDDDNQERDGGGGCDDQMASAIVLEPSRILADEPSYEGNTTVRDGDPFNITCRVSMFQVIKWQKCGRTLVTTNSASSMHSGAYRCTTQYNKFHVLYVVTAKTTIKANYDYGDKYKIGEYKSKLTLICNIEGTQYLKYIWTWFKGDNQITTDSEDPHHIDVTGNTGC